MRTHADIGKKIVELGRVFSMGFQFDMCDFSNKLVSERGCEDGWDISSKVRCVKFEGTGNFGLWQLKEKDLLVQ